MPCLQFCLTVERALAETWADALLEAGAASVQAEDAEADSLDEQPIFGEPGEAAPTFGWRLTRLTVLADAGVEIPGLLADAAAQLGLPPETAPQPESIVRVDDRDWVRATQAQFGPIDVGRRLRIAPSWHPSAAGDDRLTLVVDPGLAFGTGSHPTTRLCLEWLEGHLGSGRAVEHASDRRVDVGASGQTFARGPADTVGSVIDYGCGSGILAIAAARLGVPDVRAVDVDPQAVASTAFNAERNGARLLAGLPDEIVLAPADLVLANILSNPLKLLAPLLSSLVAPGGTLVLSGVLERQVDEVAAAYDGRIALRPWRTADGWACLVGQRGH